MEVKGFLHLMRKMLHGQAMLCNFLEIQGADICGKIVSVGKEIDESRIGEKL